MSFCGIKWEDMTEGQKKDANHFMDLDSVQFYHCKKRKKCANGSSWQPEYEFDAKNSDGDPYCSKYCKTCRDKFNLE